MQSDHGTNPSLLAGQDPRQHYCRGCGLALPLEFGGHFHKECLRADKRSRVYAQRAREQERFQRWLKKQRCPNCGQGYGDRRSSEPIETRCEASQFNDSAIREADGGPCQKRA